MSETREAALPPTALPLTSIFFSLYIIAWIKVREKEIEKERQVQDRKRFKLLAPAVRLTERTFNERERGREKERHFAFSLRSCMNMCFSHYPSLYREVCNDPVLVIANYRRKEKEDIDIPIRITLATTIYEA